MESYRIDSLHKSHNAPVQYPTIHHFVKEMHISVTKWCIVGYLSDFTVGFVRWVYWCRTINEDQVLRRCDQKIVMLTTLATLAAPTFADNNWWQTPLLLVKPWQLSVSKGIGSQCHYAFVINANAAIKVTSITKINTENVANKGII